MIRLFRTNQPYVYVLLLIYAVAIRLMPYLKASALAESVHYSFAGLYFGDWLKANISPLSLWIADVILIYGEALLLNFLLSWNKLHSKYSFVPAMVFITLSSLFPQWGQFGMETLARLFIIMSYYNLIGLSKNELSRENIFYSALFIGIGSLFYFPVMVMLPVLVYGLFLRSYSPRDFLLQGIGLVFPFYLIGIFFYYKNALPLYLTYLQKSFTSHWTNTLGINYVQAGLLILVLGLAAYGYLALRNEGVFKSIKLRRIFYLFALQIAAVVVAVPLVADNRLLFLQTLIVPASIFIASVYNVPDRLRYYDYLFFYLLLAGVVGIQIWG